ncbi:MAG TPA: hypothetical protein DCR17_08070 [Verrucomicrobiales bacterium]|nr:hypothetical protein [Verrucomicrobiales bacterium]HAQ99508.1 hypothetical protein [Verrucomicrobiales bacterium]HAW02276.1 hypothetical protein [Verrucomicrobiales bacterium]HBP55445.1 hypothetical protein [Verrucomicrobiales bacterium]HCP37675.1 hypothetical protein [Verrucomicrobiales bacterium]
MSIMVNADAGTCVSGRQVSSQETRKSIAVIIVVVEIQPTKPSITNSLHQIEPAWLHFCSE